MKKLFIILGFISAIAATILSVTKFSNLAITPIIVAFISGLMVLFLSKKEKNETKVIQYIFLLVIISFSFTIYKSVIKTSEIGDTIQINGAEQLNQQNDKNTEDSEEVLDVSGSD